MIRSKQPSSPLSPTMSSYEQAVADLIASPQPENRSLPSLSALLKGCEPPSNRQDVQSQLSTTSQKPVTVPALQHAAQVAPKLISSPAKSQPSPEQRSTSTSGLPLSTPNLSRHKLLPVMYQTSFRPLTNLSSSTRRPSSSTLDDRTPSNRASAFTPARTLATRHQRNRVTETTSNFTHPGRPLDTFPESVNVFAKMERYENHCSFSLVSCNFDRPDSCPLIFPRAERLLSRENSLLRYLTVPDAIVRPTLEGHVAWDATVPVIRSH